MTIAPQPVNAIPDFNESCGRLWSGPIKPGPQTRLFRRTFNLKTTDLPARIEIFAESRYHIWFDGAYLGRGPAFHHPTQLPVDSFEIDPAKLRATSDRHVIAVLVHAPDVSMHNHVCTGEPGLVLRFTAPGAAGKLTQVVTDEDWRVTDQSAWRKDSPRLDWAIDYVEIFDMAAAPARWREIDFDDSAWQKPTVHRPATTVPAAEFIPRPIPPLVYRHQQPTKFLGRHTIRENAAAVEPITSSGALGKSIMNAAWEPAPNQSINSSGKEFTISNLSATEGALLCFDLGAQYVGQVILDCDCPGPGTIDIGWSEVIENNRPLLVRKGVGYVNRINAVQGHLDWQPIQFSGMRYLVLVLRGFVGSVRVREFAVRTSEPEVTWTGDFQSADRRLQDIFKMCLWSLRVGTQEGQMDCPSREQSPYIADGLLTARWFVQLTGDIRHWQYLVREQFRRQSPDGLLRGAPFSGTNDPGVDYALLAVMGVRDYYQFTKDDQMVRDLIEPCRRVVAFFDRHRTSGSLCTWDFARQKAPQYSPRPWEDLYDAALPNFGDENWYVLFIDHPGLGWHNKQETGIDRRGTNAALNAFLILTKRALADLEACIGNTSTATSLRSDADHLARLLRASCYDHSRGSFVDGIDNGQPLSQISEQTNTLAVAARCCDDDAGSGLLQELLLSTDSTIARNGPYFWAYLFPELSRLGLHKLALDRTRDLWGKMLDGGATSLWETFLGDDLDTWCHPWAAAPAEFLLTSILGLPGIDFDENAIILRPRHDLLNAASGSIYTRRGLFRIEWSRTGDTVSFTGTVPEGLQAIVQDHAGRRITTARGQWTATMKL